jgi:predicted TIM-barrel fold metal-dependent hydrolase
MPPFARAIIGATAALLLVGAGGAPDAPLFDAHVHYSEPDWATYTPEAALAVLDRSGVRRALVSSTPDDGTLRLWERAKDRIVPFLRPYRTRADMATWHADPAVARYVEERLGRGVYRGIGEFHVYGPDVEGPTVRRLAELAVERDLFLHAHTDDATIGRMLDLYPRAKLLWAHAGMSAAPDSIARLLARSPRLWVELSLRNGDIAPAGTLAADWRDLFVRFPDRFLVGTDTWVTSRWAEMPAYHRDTRGWLAQLPADVAGRIASENGERLFPAR